MRFAKPLAAGAMATALAGAVLGLAGPAAAATGAPTGHHEANATGPGAITPMSVCDSRVCVSVVGDASGYTAFAKGVDFVGFVEIFGPGLPRTAGPVGPNPTVSGSGEGTGSLCALGWVRLPDGSFTPVVGLPCVSIA